MKRSVEAIADANVRLSVAQTGEHLVPILPEAQNSEEAKSQNLVTNVAEVMAKARGNMV